MPHLGLFELRTRGEQPFRILYAVHAGERTDSRRSRNARRQLGRYTQRNHSICARQVLQQVVEKVGAAYFLPPLAFDDPRWISYRLAEVLPLDGGEKQALLEMRDDGARLERLRAYLAAGSLSQSPRAGAGFAAPVPEPPH